MTCTSSEPLAARMTELITEPRTNSVSRLRWVAPMHQLGGVLGLGHLDQGGSHVGPDHLHVAAAEVVEERPVLAQALGPGAGEAVVGAHVHPDQLGLGPHGHAGGPADQHGAARASR